MACFSLTIKDILFLTCGDKLLVNKTTYSQINFPFKMNASSLFRNESFLFKN